MNVPLNILPPKAGSWLGPRIRTIADVAEFQLCCGCGACAYASPEEIEMIDVLDHGRRPRLKNGSHADPRSEEALRICPGLGLSHGFDHRTPPEGVIPELLAGWGPVLELWEGHAADPEIRYAGSSGGAASALALYAIERAGMHGLLHIAARPDAPYLNRTVMSCERAGILAATGSRYAPASPCDGLHLIEHAPTPCVFIGKPCDVAAAQRARSLRPGLDRNLGLTVAVFCAGTPTTKGTLEMLKAMGVDDPSSVESVRYRGNGWPGLATVVFRDAAGRRQVRELTYDASWGAILQRHRQWRCYVCADHTGEFADIAVGDPWYREIPAGEPGRSLVVVRTERGRRLLHEAIRLGYLTLERVGAGILPASQPNLLQTRGSIWARLLTLRAMGAPAPRFRGMPMFRFWRSRLTPGQKAQSVYGTVRRVFTKRLSRRHEMVPFVPPARTAPDGVARSGSPLRAVCEGDAAVPAPGHTRGTLGSYTVETGPPAA